MQTISKPNVQEQINLFFEDIEQYDDDNDEDNINYRNTMNIPTFNIYIFNIFNVIGM